MEQAPTCLIVYIHTYILNTLTVDKSRPLTARTNNEYSGTNH